MFHRIYTKPFTRINETWNINNDFNSKPSITYKDELIQREPNDFRKSTLYCDFYKNFSVDIVTETVFDYPYPQVTEKTIRAIIHKKMFILIAPANTLSWLREKGFKTFSPFINESYDEIEDPVQRMTAIIHEIIQLGNRSIDNIKDAMLQYEPILDHNFKHYQYLCETEISNL